VSCVVLQIGSSEQYASLFFCHENVNTVEDFKEIVLNYFLELENTDVDITLLSDALTLVDMFEKVLMDYNNLSYGIYYLRSNNLEQRNMLFGLVIACSTIATIVKKNKKQNEDRAKPTQKTPSVRMTKQEREQRNGKKGEQF